MVGTPIKKVGAPIKLVGTPMKKVGSPIKKVGAPIKMVGAAYISALLEKIKGLRADLQVFCLQIFHSNHLLLAWRGLNCPRWNEKFVDFGQSGLL